MNSFGNVRSVSPGSEAPQGGQGGRGEILIIQCRDYKGVQLRRTASWYGAPATALSLSFLSPDPSSIFLFASVFQEAPCDQVYLPKFYTAFWFPSFALLVQP
jgi:hypothetical protein